MKVKVSRHTGYGNKLLYVPLSPEVVKEAGLKEDDELNLDIDVYGKIVIWRESQHGG